MWAVGVAASMVYRRCVDHCWSMEQAGKGACMMQSNITNNLVYTQFPLNRHRINMERCIRKPFHSLESKDLYHGGHCFHPHGQHNRPWFMVDVLACSLRPGMDVLCVVYLPTQVGRYLVYKQVHTQLQRWFSIFLFMYGSLKYKEMNLRQRRIIVMVLSIQNIVITLWITIRQ